MAESPLCYGATMTARLAIRRFAAFTLVGAVAVACTPPEPARAPGECGHSHPHAHDSTAPVPASVTAHATLKSYENQGNTLRGIATPGLGAKNYEVWRTSVAVGSSTPLHRHESEEVFIFLQGKGKARIGDQEFTFEAPATVVAPANVPHQFFNVGDVPTDAIVVVGIGSKIWDAAGKEMQLPWRR